jgi:hypothetical protein
LPDDQVIEEHLDCGQVQLDGLSGSRVLSMYPAISIGGIDRRPMSEDLVYRRIEISSLGGTLPEKAGRCARHNVAVPKMRLIGERLK